MSMASKSKGLRITSWVLQVLVALFFIMTGVQKLMGAFPSPELFQRIGEWADPGFRYVVGAWEITAAVLLLVPKTIHWGALLVVLAMIGAFGTHVGTPLGMFPEFVDPSSADGDKVTMPFFMSLIFLALGAVILFLRRDGLPIGKGKGAGGEIGNG